MLNMQIIAGCQSTDMMTDYISQYDEIPFVGGPGVFRRFDGELAEGDFKMYVNPNTQTFTLTVEFPSDNIVCIVFMGDDLKPVAQGQSL